MLICTLGTTSGYCLFTWQQSTVFQQSDDARAFHSCPFTPPQCGIALVANQTAQIWSYFAYLIRSGSFSWLLTTLFVAYGFYHLYSGFFVHLSPLVSNLSVLTLLSMTISGGSCSFPEKPGYKPHLTSILRAIYCEEDSRSEETGRKTDEK